MPAGVINVVPPSGVNCTLGTGEYVCNLTTPLAPNASLPQLTFRGQVAVAGVSDITAEAFVSNANPLDPNPVNDDAAVSIAVTNGTDAFISKNRTPGSGTLLVGDEVTFTLGTGFIGNAPSDVVVTDTLPANYELVSVSNTGGYACVDDGDVTVTCTLAAASANGQSQPQNIGDITIVARLVSAGQNIINTADIDFGGPSDVDVNPANNSASDTALTVQPPVIDLQGRKFGPDPALAVVGNAYNFNVSARNGGNAPFDGTLTLTDNLPAGLQVTFLNTRGATCTVGGQVITSTSNVALSPAVDGPATFVCTRDYTTSPLATSTNTPSITFRTVVTAPGLLTNAVEVTSGDPGIDGTNPGNNIAEYAVTSVFGGNAADIQAIKRLAGSNQVVAGQPISFELEIRNNGPMPSE